MPKLGEKFAEAQVIASRLRDYFEFGHLDVSVANAFGDATYIAYIC